MTTSIQCAIRKLRKGQMKRGQSIVLIMIAMPALLPLMGNRSGFRRLARFPASSA